MHTADNRESIGSIPIIPTKSISNPKIERMRSGRCGLVATLMDIHIPSLELTNGIMRDKYVSGAIDTKTLSQPVSKY